MGLVATGWFRSSGFLRYFGSHRSGVNKPGAFILCYALFCRIEIIDMVMLRDILRFQGNACFPARCPVVRPVPAVDKAGAQVWRAVSAVAQVPFTVYKPRVFINREPVFKRTGERRYSSG